MKFINKLLKILGIIILIFVSICIPISIISADFVNLVLEPGELVGIIDDELLDTDVFADIAENAVEYYERDEQMELLSAQNRALVTSLDELSDRKLENLFELLLPPKMLRDTLEEIDGGFFEWLNSSKSTVEFEFDTRGWKENTFESIAPIVDMIFKELPTCTRTDFIEMYDLMQQDSAEDINPCRPPDEVYAEIVESIEGQVGDLLDPIKDEIQVDNLVEGNEADVKAFKSSLLLTRTIARYGLIIVIFFFFIGVGLGTRSVKTFFKQAGWPLILASLPLISVGFVIKFVPYDAIYQILANSGETVPIFIYEPFTMVLNGIFSILGSGYLTKGLIILAIGAVSTIIGFIIGKVIENNKE